MAKNFMPPKTHKLGDLLGLLPAAIPDNLRRRLLLLDRYYIPTRYPDALPGSLETGMPEQPDAEEALACANALDEWAAS